jgi:hypothetical protein
MVKELRTKFIVVRLEHDALPGAHLLPVSAMVWRGLGIWSDLGVQAPKYLYNICRVWIGGVVPIYLQPVSAMA